jgi:prolyl-tRNA synthetase
MNCENIFKYGWCIDEVIDEIFNERIGVALPEENILGVPHHILIRPNHRGIHKKPTVYQNGKQPQCVRPLNFTS